jgi:lipoprotein-anchoring transpeptidase ErfK/SrfK
LERKYGPHGWITLNPVAGQALEAKRNGRFGLLIHGGAPGAGGALRPTFGCLRLTNGDMRGLMEIVGQIPASLLRCQVREKS